MNLAYQLILASKSPRRQELLKSLELDFTVEVYPTDESFPQSLPPKEVAAHIAKQKARAFRGLKENELLLTSDTVVVNDGTILGKPANHKEALDMLSGLSNKTHQVMTAVCLTTLKQQIDFTVNTDVHFTTLSLAQIKHYIDQYQPFDKAGSYGIQEWIGKIGISYINGDYYNVMGLPLYQLNKVLLKEFSS